MCILRKILHGAGWTGDVPIGLSNEHFAEVRLPPPAEFYAEHNQKPEFLTKLREIPYIVLDFPLRVGHADQRGGMTVSVANRVRNSLQKISHLLTFAMK